MRLLPIFALRVALVALVAVTTFPPFALPQSKRSHSDEDIDATGHRDIGKGPNLYSLEKEKQLGSVLAQGVERSSRLIDDPVVNDYVKRVAQSIALNSDATFPISVRVIDSDVIDALTLPGGFQYINKGLILQTEGEAELAGVLAHGIAHTAMRDSTKEATKGEVLQLATIPLFVLGPGGWAGYSYSQGLNLAIPVTYLKFRRDAEFAADFYGVQYLYKAGYSADSYPAFLERVWPKASRGQNIPSPCSPFPPLPERLNAIREEIARLLPQRNTEIVSSSDFEAVKEHLHALQPEGKLRKPTLRIRTDGSSMNR